MGTDAAIRAQGSGMRGQQLYLRAKVLIPGGTQLLSKRSEMFLPEEWSLDEHLLNPFYRPVP